MAEIPVPKSVTEGSRNMVTTVLGLLGGVLSYYSQIGVAMPSTGREWAASAFSAVLFALGLSGADAAKLAELAGKKK